MEFLDIFGDTLGAKLVGIGVIVLIIAGISMNKNNKGGGGGSSSSSSTPPQS